MCRDIKKLRYTDRAPTEEELELAALQFVRKVTGYRKPSHANEEVFDAAVTEITSTTGRLFAELTLRRRRE